MCRPPSNNSIQLAALPAAADADRWLRPKMEQIERSRRYLVRMSEMYRAAPFREDKEQFADDVLSFFIHAYHIRDWIAELNKIGIRKEDVDAFMNQHEELRICADLCNGSKHCHLRSARTGKEPHLASRSFISSGTNDVMHSTQCKFSVFTGEKFIDALELAERCMELWDDFVGQMSRSSQQRRS
jgi:hypothetical protein